MSDHRGTLEALDRILNRGGDADDILRQIVAVLANRYDHVTIRFVEGDGLVEGPSAGRSCRDAPTWPIEFGGMKVAQLEVSPAGDRDRRFLERVATLISPYCLVGWDTGGRAWKP